MTRAELVAALKTKEKGPQTMAPKTDRDLALVLSDIYSKTYTSRDEQWRAVVTKARELLVQSSWQEVPGVHEIRDKMRNDYKLWSDSDFALHCARVAYSMLLELQAPEFPEPNEMLKAAAKRYKRLSEPVPTQTDRYREGWVAARDAAAAVIDERAAAWSKLDDGQLGGTVRALAYSIRALGLPEGHSDV
jgi:hypothetical protein